MQRKPANTSAKTGCQAHTACYWQHHSSGSQVPSELQCPELLKSLSWRIVKSVSNVTKKRCKDWRKPNARLLATPGARKSAPWLSDTLLLCTEDTQTRCIEPFQKETYGKEKITPALPLFLLTTMVAVVLVIMEMEELHSLIDLKNSCWVPAHLGLVLGIWGTAMQKHRKPPFLMEFTF